MKYWNILAIVALGFSLVSCSNDEPAVVEEPEPVDYLLGEEYVMETVTASDAEACEMLQRNVWKWDQSCLYNARSKKLISRDVHSAYYKFSKDNIVMTSSDKETFEVNPNYVYVVENQRLIIKSKNYDGTEVDYYTIVRLDAGSVVLDYDSVAYLNEKGDTTHKALRKSKEIYRMRYVSCE